MNITEAFKSLEEYSDFINKGKSEQIDNIFQQLSEHINSDSFDFKEVYQSDKRFPRVLLYTFANEKTIKKLANSSIQDTRFPTLTSHFLLVKASMFNEETTAFRDILQILEHHSSLLDEPGSTLGFALGFVVGKYIALGIDASTVVQLSQGALVTSRKVFLNGLQQGYTSIQDNKNSSLGLAYCDSYFKDICERYEEHWNTDTIALLFHTIRHYTKHFEQPNLRNDILKYNPEQKFGEEFSLPFNIHNEKAIWYLYGSNPNADVVINIAKIFKKYHLQNEQFIIKEQIKEVLVEVESSPVNVAAKNLLKVAEIAKENLQRQLLKAKQDKLEAIETQDKLENTSGNKKRWNYN